MEPTTAGINHPGETGPAVVTRSPQSLRCRHGDRPVDPFVWLPGEILVCIFVLLGLPDIGRLASLSRIAHSHAAPPLPLPSLAPPASFFFFPLWILLFF